MDELTEHQLQTYWSIKELFPNVSGDAIRANVDQGTARLAEMILAGALPTGDEFMRDSDAPMGDHTTHATQDQPNAAAGFWNALSGLRARVTKVFRPREPEEAEPPLTDDERVRLERVLDVVDEELFERASSALPNASLSWILLNIDFGLDYLMANRDSAPPRRTLRRDNRGVSYLVKSRLSTRRRFECVVCFEEYDEGLAVACSPNVNGGGGWRMWRGRAATASHSFCADCVRGHARVAVEQNVIAPSGIGLKCMQPDCTHVLLRAHVEQVLDAQTRTALEQHYAHEALTAAGLETESCPRCGFTVHISESPEDSQVFHCQECAHEYCRRCNRVWDEKHRAKSCDELTEEEHIDKQGWFMRVLSWFGLVSLPPSAPEAALRKYREAAERLTAMTVHSCPRCKKAYQKSSACNKITCPCGQASCYVCGMAITGYDHFGVPGLRDGCSLWEDTAARENAEAAAELQRQIGAAENRDVARNLRLLQGG